VTDFPQPADPGRRPAEPLGPVLRRLLRRTGLAHAGDREKVWAAWEELLGRDAAHTRLEGLRKGTAQFVVDSSALLSELNNFRRQALLEGLQARVRSPFISNLKFRLEKRAS
jgi:predicted nucleic acid-binding Zn ribbon protein